MSTETRSAILRGMLALALGAALWALPGAARAGQPGRGSAPPDAAPAAAPAVPVPGPGVAVTTDRFTATAVIGLAVVLLCLFFAQRNRMNRVMDRTRELVQELSERQREEAALRESEEKYRTLFESSQDALMTLEPPGWAFTSGNPATVAMFGAGDEAAFVKAAPWQLSPEFQPDGRRSDEQAREMIETAMRQGSHSFEWRHTRMDGEEFSAAVLLTRFRFAGRTLLQATVRDLTESERGQRALRAAENKCRAVVDGAAEGILVADVETLRFTYVNPAICEMLGYGAEELLGMGVPDIHPAEDLDRVMATFRAQARGEQVLAAELPCRHRDGRTIVADIRTTSIEHGGRRCCVGFFTDITGRRKTEEQLRHAQKLEAVGQLAGGVAHEFNNLLMGVGGYAQLLLGQFPDQADARRDLARICELAERGARLSRQLLTFSRREAGEPRVIDLNAVVADAQKMLRRLLPENIDLITRLDPELARVRADPGQIEQVLMNLVVNARDAMPAGGTLHIETANAELDDVYAATHAGVSPGRYARLTVADTGCGMPAEVQARLFEPFFTTKGVGQGTGLGLATLYGIVRQHGGHVAVYSEVGRGSAFKIHLPPVAGGAGTGARTDAPAELGDRGSETLLLVEDETSVRRVVSRALEDRGYRVLAAADGVEAELLFREHGADVALLITDWAMPGRNGREIHDALAKARPGLRALFMSAYPSEIVCREGGFAGRDFIQKPFAFCELARRVREALDGAAAGPGCVREAAGD